MWRTSVARTVQFAWRTSTILASHAISPRAVICFIEPASSSFSCRGTTRVQHVRLRCSTWSSCGTISTTKFRWPQCLRNMKTSLLIFCAKIVIWWVITSVRSLTSSKRSLIFRSRQFCSTSLDSSARTASAAATTRLGRKNAPTARSPRRAQNQTAARTPTMHLPALPTLKTT